MTTTISLAARDFIVVGADSLATDSRTVVLASDLINNFFNANGDLKMDANGKPTLSTLATLHPYSKSVAVNQLPSVTKLFSLEPKKAALLFAGIARIGEVSIKNLVEQFTDSSAFQAASTVEHIAERFRDFVRNLYETEISLPENRPTMEVLLSGYSNDSRQPEVFRITFAWDWSMRVFEAEAVREVDRGKYDIVFAGQYDVIQRVVSGVDVNSWVNLRRRSQEVLEAYKAKVEADLAAHGHQLTVISPDPNDVDLDLFSKNWGGVTRLFAQVADLSEQAGTEFVHFLITTMMRAHDFSDSIPTVGGEIHMAVITKNSGFQWVHKPYLQRAGNNPNH